VLSNLVVTNEMLSGLLT